VGERILRDVLKYRRATYGEEICSTVSDELTADFRQGYSRPNVKRMIWFAETFSDRDVIIAP
jgi:hypothetical protein